MPRWRRRSASSRSAAASTRAATRCCRWAAAARCTPARWPANSASRASPCRRIPACCRPPACCPRRSSTRSRPPSSATRGRSTWPEVRAALDSLDAACGGLMRAEGVPAERTRIRYFADVCYIGQSLSPRNPAGCRRCRPARSALPRLPRRARPHLRPQHRRRRPASSICARVHRQPVDRPAIAAADAPAGGKAVRRASADARHPDRRKRPRRSPAESTTARRWRPALEIAGPAIVEQTDTTTLIEPGWRGDGRRRAAPCCITPADGDA